ncbi:MAG: hypothetical protein ACEY3J_01170 [Arsenophonus sp.]
MHDIKMILKNINILALRLGAKLYDISLILIAIFCLILFSLVYIHHLAGLVIFAHYIDVIKSYKESYSLIPLDTYKGMKHLLENMLKA